MSGESPERGHAEPIDADFEPADRARRRAAAPAREGVGFATALGLSAIAAMAGAAGGAIGAHSPAVSSVFAGGNDPARAAREAATAEVAGLRSEIARMGMEGRLARLENLASTGATTVETAALSGGDPILVGARIQGLQTSLQAVETRLATAATATEVAGLAAQLQALQADFARVQADAERATRAAAASYAVAAATEAARASGSFESAQQTLAALLPNDPNVIALAPLARTGAPTVPELRDRFKAMEVEVIRAARLKETGVDTWARLNAWLAQFIVVRQVGQGDDATDVVDRARQRLEADDLAGAVTELERLRGASKQYLDPWLVQARTRVQIDQRLALIRAELSRGS